MKFASNILVSGCFVATFTLSSVSAAATKKMRLGRGDPQEGQGRRKLPGKGKGKGKGMCMSLSTGASCSLSEGVATGTNTCEDYETFGGECPTESDVCDPSFTVESFCQDTVTGGSTCPDDCALAVSACCEVTCCEDTCLEEEQVCDLLEMFTCPDINFELCPCGEEERTTFEYCDDLVGAAEDAACQTACETYVNDCCAMTSMVFRRSIWINELHYNENGGTNVDSIGGNDDNEYVEIAFTNSVDLAGYQLLAFNGQQFNGQQPNDIPYETITLSSSPLVDMETGVNFLQVPFALLEDGGGSAGDEFHDAIALVDPEGNVVEFISYGRDSNILATTHIMTRMINGVSVTSDPLPMGVTETPDLGNANNGVINSIQRQGTDGCAGEDFTWAGPVAPTPGLKNDPQTFDCAL